jgi:uncharacterized protein YceK
MKKTNNTNIMFAIFAAVMLGLLIAMTMAGCSSVRHYKKVAADSTVKRTKEQKYLLSLACADCFPVVAKKGTVTIDTAYIENNAAIDACASLVDSLLSLKPKTKTDTLYKDSIMNIVKTIIPKAKVITNYRVDTVPDEAAIFMLKTALEITGEDLAKQTKTTAEKQAQITKFEQDKKSLQTLAKWFFVALIKKWWFWFLLLILAMIKFGKSIVNNML